ncbi:hypothetical protein [Streptomyces sp. RPT161]|uniref:hypothetical protein n=1 Tax=Streptomyces sp. RPT161 TaxID=3015993 RepID=UPI0022B93322|nr:hypothetical protein [Streptomyces sp. RPT161]
MTARAPLPIRPRRRLSSLAALALLACTATGCVTVHGADAVVPAVGKADAPAALDHFAQVVNDADSKLDPSLNAQVETGALGAIDGAGIKARHVNSPSGNPGYQPLRFSDTRFLIPRERGWPKWFVADTANSRDRDRWLLVFTRDSVKDAWRASYLSVLAPGQLPDFATDGQGYAVPVPVGGTDLLVQPGELGARYTAYLQQGDKGSTAFAQGSQTSGLRAQRRTQYAPTSQVVTQFADEPADPVQYAPVALRLRDGGALVFFTTRHEMKQTVAKGPVVIKDPNVNALLTGTPNRSVTLYKVAEQVVKVPARSDAGAKVVFLNRIEGLVSASGA